MSAIRSWTIQCDGCGNSDGGDLGAQTAAERRRDLAFDYGDGAQWSVSAPGGTDWCGECRADGTMRAALQRHYMRRRFSR